jgi:NADPH:quinone reductase
MMMKMARIHGFGGPEMVQVDEVARPVPRERQVLLKVGACSLNHIDLSLRRGELKVPARLLLPRPFGFDVAGEVVECGAGVTGFLVGDRVAGMTSWAAGGSADYCRLHQSHAALLPDGIGWAEAAAVPLAAATALQALRGHAHLRHGQRILINGASGGVGGFAVQLAKIFGAHVTAVCRSEHFEYVRGLGADEVADYRDAPSGGAGAGGRRFDVIFDAAAKLEMGQVKAWIHHGGHVVTTRPEPRQVMGGLLERVRGAFRMHIILTKPRGGDFAFLFRLVREGRLRPVVAKTFPLDDAAGAHRWFEEHSVAGKLVILA